MFFSIITEQDCLLPLYITGMGIQSTQEDISRPSGLPDYQWLFTTHGSGIVCFGDKSYTIHEGMGFYFRTHIPHSYHALDGRWETYWVIFNGTFADSLFQRLDFGDYGTFEFPRTQLASMIHDFSRTLRRLQDDSMDGILTTGSYIYDQLITTKKHILTSSLSHTSGNNEDAFIHLLDYMAYNYKRDLSLNELASLLSITPSHLCKLFKKRMGVTPIQYLIRIRLQEAKKQLLLQPDTPIREIAYAVGYPDTSYFTKIFKHQESMTPSMFRHLHGKH